MFQGFNNRGNSPKPSVSCLLNSSNNDVMIASLQRKGNKLVAWSTKARLNLIHPSARRPSSAWTIQKLSGNPTSPLTENECSATPSRFFGVSGTIGSSPFDSMSENSAPIDVPSHQPPPDSG